MHAIPCQAPTKPSAKNTNTQLDHKSVSVKWGVGVRWGVAGQEMLAARLRCIRVTQSPRTASLCRNSIHLIP